MNQFEAAQIVIDRQTAIIHKLQSANLSFALSGSNAVYHWIENADPSSVRQFRNIDLIANRSDQVAVISALTYLKLIPEERDNYLLLRNEHTTKDRWSDRVYFAGEAYVGTDATIPTLDNIDIVKGVPIVSLSVLVEFLLLRFNLNDKVDLRDLIDVGLIDQSWPNKFPLELGQRLQQILDTPDG
jgi:hypothetical protein